MDNRRYKGFNLLSTELTALYLCAYTGAHGNIAGAWPRTAFVVSVALLFIVATGSLGSFHTVILVLTYLLARFTPARMSALSAMVDRQRHIVAWERV